LTDPAKKKEKKVGTSHIPAVHGNVYVLSVIIRSHFVLLPSFIFTLPPSKTRTRQRKFSVRQNVNREEMLSACFIDGRGKFY
jgi:hypothetical protein